MKHPMALRGGGAIVVLAALALLAACSPEVGSKAWCDELAAKPKGDWTANQGADYAKHCILK